MIKVLAIVMVVCQFSIGFLSFGRNGGWKQGILGILFGIANAIIFLL